MPLVPARKAEGAEAIGGRTEQEGEQRDGDMIGKGCLLGGQPDRRHHSGRGPVARRMALSVTTLGNSANPQVTFRPIRRDQMTIPCSILHPSCLQTRLRHRTTGALRRWKRRRVNHTLAKTAAAERTVASLLAPQCLDVGVPQACAKGRHGQSHRLPSCTLHF